MHILFVTGEYPPQRGGVGAYTEELAKALVGQGVQVSVITSRAMSAASDANLTADTESAAWQRSLTLSSHNQKHYTEIRGGRLGAGTEIHREKQEKISISSRIAQSVLGGDTENSQRTQRDSGEKQHGEKPSGEKPSGEKYSGEKSATLSVYRLIDRWGPQIWSTIAHKATEVGADWIHVQYQTAAFAMNPAINFAPQRWRRKFVPNAMAGGTEVRTAWTYHDLLVPYLFPKAGARLRRWVTERPAHAADLVVVTNEGDRQGLSARIANPLKIPIGSNIASANLFTAERKTVRTRWSYSPGDVVLAYFGFLNRSKGGTTLIQTLYHLSQQPEFAEKVHLLMIGERVGASDPTNFAYLQEVEALITELGLSGRVQWTGHLPDADVAAALNVCDVLLMPYEDGASLRRGTLMAGLANGCAIVTTTPATPLPELVDGEHLIYVAPGDAEAAAFAIERLLSDAKVADALRQNARKQSQLFRWDSIAERHVELYGCK